MPLIAAWDILAFCIWLMSFTRNRFHWRDAEYCLIEGSLYPSRSSERHTPNH